MNDTVGKDARSAVKTAVTGEDVAGPVHIASQLGSPKPINPPDIDSLWERYRNVYGQR